MASSISRSVSNDATFGSASSRLLRSCVSGDVAAVESLREDFSVKGLVDFESARTALHYVVYSGESAGECAAILLESGCPADVVDVHGITPFVQASMYACQSMLDAYRSGGHADNLDTGPYGPGCVARAGWTNLMRACHANRVPQIQHCLARGDDVDARNLHGQTALHVAVDAGRTLAVQMLLDAGCDVDAQDVFAWTPLMIACRRRQRDMATTLLGRSADARRLDVEGHSVLHTAIMQGSTEILGCLLQFDPGLFVTAVTARGSGSRRHPRSPLQLALACQRERVVQWFVDDGAPVSRSSLDDALTVAVRLDNFVLTRRLVAMGAAVGSHHVAMAVQREDNDLCRYLIACGVSFKTDGGSNAGNGGSAPLIVACRKSNIACIRMLLEAGARANSERGGAELSSIPLAVALCNGGSRMAFELLRAGADPDMDRFCVTSTGLVAKPRVCATRRRAPNAASRLPDDFATSVQLCLQAGAKYDELSRIWREPGAAEDDSFEWLRGASRCPALQRLCAAAVWRHLIARRGHGGSFLHVQKAVEQLPVPAFARDLLLFPYALQGRTVLSQLWANRALESPQIG